ncbi:DUF397 domain-containing protein [Streptosporangiaceae bacterium NEAU-GS5]|nr:DUF397 domain-containing protein [Streptosporangiaceae bacterium NEAU-GS5]
MLTTQWVKSSWSGDGSGCVEARLDDQRVLVRDTKQAGQGPILVFTHTEWAAFLKGARSGEFDLPGSVM